MKSQPELDLVTAAILFYKRLRALAFTTLIRGCFHSFGCGSRVEPPFRFAGLRDVAIGPQVYVAPNCWINVVGPARADRSPKLTIGPGCAIGMGATLTASWSVTLGSRVLLARNVYVSDHGHEYREVDRAIMEQGVTEPRAVAIGDDTWLGQNACILPGVRIGRHCVVGANAVVTRDVPDFTVVAGVPAVVIRAYDATARAWVAVARSDAGGSKP